MLNQLVSVERTIKANKMKVVHEIDLPGVSGSVPGNRWDIDEFIRHKEKTADFKFLLLPSVNRFTRAGGRHGEVLLWNLEVAGIVVYFVADGLFSDVERDKGRIHDLLKAAREDVSSDARAGVEGYLRAFLSGKCPYTKRPPFGMDRKIATVEGKPLYVVRNLRNGTQVILHHKTGRVIRKLGLNPETGKPIKFRKQKTDRVALVPGAKEDCAVVARIMKLVWVDKLKIRAVARALNDDDILSPMGTGWCERTVAGVARRPIYIGRGYRGMTKGGVYWEETEDGAVDAHVSTQDLARLKRAPSKRKPIKAWMKKDYPHLRNFLPASVREPARIGIEWELARRAPGKSLVGDTNRHNSNFFLSRRLFTVEGTHVMTGCSVNNRKYRFYRCRKTAGQPKSNDRNALMVPAHPLEAAVLSILRDVLLNNPALRQVMAKAVKTALARMKTSGSPAVLERRLIAARVRQADLSDRRTGNDKLDAPFVAKLAKVDAEVAALMASLGTTHTGPRGSTEQIVSGLMKEFATLGSALDANEVGNRGLDPEDCGGIGAMLDFFLQRLVVDPTTRDGEIAIAVPDWVDTALLSVGRVCVVQLFDHSVLHEKTAKNGHILLSAKLKFDWKNKKYDIEIKKRAA